MPENLAKIIWNFDRKMPREREDRKEESHLREVNQPHTEFIPPIRHSEISAKFPRIFAGSTTVITINLFKFSKKVWKSLRKFWWRHQIGTSRHQAKFRLDEKWRWIRFNPKPQLTTREKIEYESCRRKDGRFSCKNRQTRPTASVYNRKKGGECQTTTSTIWAVFRSRWYNLYREHQKWSRMATRKRPQNENMCRNQKEVNIHRNFPEFFKKILHSEFLKFLVVTCHVLI